MSLLSDEQQEMIETMRVKQKLDCVVDITMNIQSLKLIVKTFDCYKSDALDAGEAKAMSDMMVQVTESIFHLSNRLTALTDNISGNGKT